MVEKQAVAKILKYLRTQPECFCWKEHGGMYGTTGIPDIICCFRGHFVAFEVKTETGRLTKLQSVALEKINAAGGKAYKVTSLDEVRAILNDLEE
jgi:hypothetical protein